MTVPLNLSVAPAAQPMIDQAAAALPQIQTERLTLRAPRLSDWPVLAPIWTTDRARFIGGPMSAKDAWLDFCQLTVNWLLRGFGALTICRRSDDAVLGLVLLEHELGDPEPELGWLLIAEADGHGFATEAASALRTEGLRLFGSGGFVSYIDAANDRSIRLAERLHAVRDAEPHPGNAATRVYRHRSTKTRS